MTGRRAHDDGAALVEFTLVAVMLMVPLVYLVMVGAAVQRAAFAAISAVRDGGRAYAVSASDTEGRTRAALAVQTALRDVRRAASHVVLRCSPDPCTSAPGSTVTVSVEVLVPMPGLGALLCGGTGCPASIPVRARHTERLDCYAAGHGAPLAGRC